MFLMPVICSSVLGCVLWYDSDCTRPCQEYLHRQKQNYKASLPELNTLINSWNPGAAGIIIDRIISNFSNSLHKWFVFIESGVFALHSSEASACYSVFTMDFAELSQLKWFAAFQWSDESPPPVRFNVIIMYFGSDATQHLIRKRSFHSDRLILSQCYDFH